MGFSTHRKMVLFSGYFGVFLSYLLRALFWVFSRIFTRYLTPEPVNSVPSSTLSYRTDSNFSEVGFSNSPGKSECDSRESDVVVSNDHHKPPESEPKIASSDSEMVDHTDNNNVNDNTEDEEENDTPKLVFKFQYQTWKCGEEPNDTHREIHDFTNNPGTETTASASKYEVVSGKSLSHFFEESKVSIFTVEELFAHSNDDDDDDGSLEKREINDSNSKFSSSESGKDQTENFNINNNTNSSSDSEEDDVDMEDDDLGYEAEDFDEEDREVMEELRMIEQECLSESAQGPNCKAEEELGEKEKEKDEVEEWNNGYDTLWEHQELIEQLKMELKKVRATGLPTILEDSESPRIMEDLKPWKIDDKLHSNTTSTSNDLPKFYRSYRERMRKFDILNYQKMYAIGLLESKEAVFGFWVENNKSKKRCEKEGKKLMKELYSEVEMVYVGQLCLSWEFLQWEYEKALELWESDPYASKTYNEVAGEFQHFIVLLQRFLENESFQGPRVHNYVRNRFSMRNLLQVPLIREDKKKLRKTGSDSDEDGIIVTSDMLVEILEESIRTIWRFIRSDKLASNSTNPLHLQDDVADSALLHQLRLDLHKKEKRVREALRSGSCILKKFQKQLREEEATDHQVVYFFAQVDMKLVWRVLNMTRITSDQLAWCRNKLNNIHFVNRTVHVDPTFLLFPC